MDRIVREYLETKYDGKFELIVTRNEPIYMELIYKGNQILSGTVNEGPNFTSVSWTIRIDTWDEMNKYVPLTNPNDYSEIISWFRKKCKKQGINFLNPTFHNKKYFRG